jgi:hypothetical protein
MFRRRTRRGVSEPTAEGLTRIDRRRWLRLSGMAAAGAAGATVVGAAGAATAGAADGGTMILGRANDSGLKDTRLTAQIYKSAFNVTNTGVGPALGATGHPIAAGGSIAAAGHGRALDVVGVATFSRSGVVEFTIDSSTVVEVPVPGGLKASSLVFAMAQKLVRPGNPHYPIAAEPNVLTGKIKIHLNANVDEGDTLKVAWFVIG